ncbi:DUF6925 family protein [Azospirillum agricola]|uniref:DUF6925 family protein n=1 Tax=Azospirillum agricola TaxID=1720247 RepID=UPI000A0F373B|nr:hypothetical protein [Azospirillum agricola]SMH46757.1 hypothetical protein SAMN02982994_2482 [Azospirillum lipoferum]
MTDALPHPGPSGLAALLRHAVGDPDTAWSLGSFGAVAEFMRDPGETVRLGERDAGGAMVLEARTARGGLRIRLDPALRPFAFETAAGTGWSQSVALCLPAGACAMAGRRVVTELGPDSDAIDPKDREAILFDLGLDLPQTDACVRSADPRVIERIRAGAGLPMFDPDSPLRDAWPALSPERIFVCRFGRIEVSQPIPPPDGRSPEGPHTHVLPRLLAARRTHAATAPIPEGWTPCLHLFPPHPLKDPTGRPIPFDAARHAAFQTLLEHWGDPSLTAFKRDIRGRLDRGEPPAAESELDRFQRMTVRATLRQVAAMGASAPRLAEWSARFDRPEPGPDAAPSDH